MKIMPYHGPGWTHIAHGFEYLVWSPAPGRQHWSACWQSLSEIDDSGMRRAGTLDEVLGDFPDSIAKMFKEVIGQ